MQAVSLPSQVFHLLKEECFRLSGAMCVLMQDCDFIEASKCFFHVYTVILLEFL